MRGGALSPSRFAQIPDALLADASVSATAVRVYAIIVRYQGRHEVAWPGLRTVALDYGIPRSTVSRCVAELEDAGWLGCERRPGTSTLYRPADQVSHQRDTVSHPRDGVSHQRDVTIVRNESQEGDPPSPPEGGPTWEPVKVDRKTVSPAERDLTDGILAEFNVLAGSSFSGTAEHRRAIVGRIREHPAFDLPAHARLMVARFASPYWKDAPSPRVIYGNASVFEEAIEVAKATKANAGPTEADLARREAERLERAARDERILLERQQARADRGATPYAA